MTWPLPVPPIETEPSIWDIMLAAIQAKFDDQMKASDLRRKLYEEWEKRLRHERFNELFTPSFLHPDANRPVDLWDVYERAYSIWHDDLPTADHETAPFKPMLIRQLLENPPTKPPLCPAPISPTKTALASLWDSLKL